MGFCVGGGVYHMRGHPSGKICSSLLSQSEDQQRVELTIGGK